MPPAALLIEPIGSDNRCFILILPNSMRSGAKLLMNALHELAMKTYAGKGGQNSDRHRSPHGKPRGAIGHLQFKSLWL